MKRLHVAIVIPGFPAEREEPGLAAIVDLVERVAATNEVSVVALRHPPRRDRYEMAGSTVRALGFGHAGGALGRARVFGGGLSAMLRIHRGRPIDVLHGMWADEAGAIAAVVGRLIRRPAVVSVLGGELVALPDIGYGAALGRGGRWTVRAALRLADAVTAGSGHLRNQVLERRPDTRVDLAPLGLDTVDFKPAAARPREDTVLFVGSLEPVKDPLLMLRTFAAVSADRPKSRLVIAGAGSLRSAVEDAARMLGIAEDVTFAGQLPRSQMPDLYRSASVLCVTSRHEAQSMAAVEAAMSGLPVVGTRVGVLPDLGDGALVVDAADERQLASALASVLDDEMLAQQMGRAGREQALQRYATETAARNFLDLYGELVSGRSSLDRRH